MDTAPPQADRPTPEIGSELPPNMRAAIIERYGDANQLTVREIPRPTCNDQQVLIRVAAAGINPIDWRIRSGSLRFVNPAWFPLVLGFDVAGRIVALGSKAAQKGWRVGDEVLAFLDDRHGGGYAEYAVASAGVLTKKPDSVSFEEAASIPLAASTALQALRDYGKLAAGDRVLINGASGGVGVFAVQVAKILGSEVTGACSEQNATLLRDLGADRVIDYHRTDFTSENEQYHVVFDVVAKSTFRKCRSIIKPGGCYINTVPSPSLLLFQLATRWSRRRCYTFLARPDGKDLGQLAQWMDEKKLRTIIHQNYALDQVAEAHQQSESGHTRGKLVLRV